MPWNVAGHRRKFLIAPGDYVDADDRHDDVEVVFWGEWEPPSRIERRWPASGGQRLPDARACDGQDEMRSLPRRQTSELSWV